MEKVSGVLVMVLLEILKFFVLIIGRHFMLIIKRINFLVLVEGPSE